MCGEEMETSDHLFASYFCNDSLVWGLLKPIFRLSAYISSMKKLRSTRRRTTRDKERKVALDCLIGSTRWTPWKEETKKSSIEKPPARPWYASRQLFCWEAGHIRQFFCWEAGHPAIRTNMKQPFRNCWLIVNRTSSNAHLIFRLCTYLSITLLSS